MAVQDGGANLEANVYLSSKGPAAEAARFDFPWLAAGETTLNLFAVDVPRLRVDLRCDGPGRVIPAGEAAPGEYLYPGERRQITVPLRTGTRAPRLVLSPETRRCSLSWGNGAALALVREDIGDPVVAQLDAAQADCALPAPDGLNRLERLFFSAGGLSQTCPMRPGAVTYHPDELEALGTRLEWLTGGKVSRAALAAYDPDMPLDFSNAPRFDEIIVSYMHIRADVTGALTMRALEHHARRGTKIRIIASKRLMLGLGLDYLEKFAARTPNVTLQFFRWMPPGLPTVRDVVDSNHRTYHIKLFLGLSPVPGASFAMVGGRNLHDGFYAQEVKAFEGHPELRHYTEESEGFLGLAFHDAYEDFEIAVHDRAAVAEIASHFGKLWSRDRAGDVLLAATGTGEGARSSAREGLVRHYISLPWADGRALEDYYTEMIDAAEHTLDMITPFNYPTARIDAALLRAAARGVRVRLVTREVSSEPPGIATWALNYQYMREREDDFAIRMYNPGGNRLVHTKIIIVDGRLGVVASANLNRRTFLHDAENGLVFLDRGVAAGLTREFDRYWAAGTPRTGRPPFELLEQLFDAMPLLKQYF